MQITKYQSKHRIIEASDMIIIDSTIFMLKMPGKEKSHETGLV